MPTLREIVYEVNRRTVGHPIGNCKTPEKTFWGLQDFGRLTEGSEEKLTPIGGN